MKPHKHAELIKAWADGKLIQVKGVSGWVDSPSPVWRDNLKYRIKPEAKPNIRYETNIRWHEGWQHVETSAEKESNLRLLFDGKTGELIFAEVLK